MQKAIGYIRVSTQGQADEGVSLAAQRAKIEAWCNLNDNKVVALACRWLLAVGGRWPSCMAAGCSPVGSATAWPIEARAKPTKTAQRGGLTRSGGG